MTMVKLAHEYLAYRHSLGVELRSAGALLLQFARYADRSGHRGPLTARLAIRWAGLPRHVSRVHLAHRLDVIRCFAKHRAIFDRATEIPPNDVFGPAYRRVTPDIFNAAELSALLAAARDLPPRDSLRPHTYATLFGLLASTGLRLREALQLTRADVDWGRSLVTVRQSKFRKSRLVPLHPTATQALRAYARLRDRHHPAPKSDAFFLSVRGTRLAHATAEAAFLQLRRGQSWRPQRGRALPRIHDLRHTFACRRLALWQEQGADVEQRLLALSTYLGHACLRDTYWYLTAVPELLQSAGSRFEHFSEPTPGETP